MTPRTLTMGPSSSSNPDTSSTVPTILSNYLCTPGSIKQEAAQLNVTVWTFQTKAKTRPPWPTGSTFIGRTRALRRFPQTKQRISKQWRTRSMPCRRHNTIAIAIVTQASEVHCYQRALLTGRAGTHARTQGIVKGMLIVKDDLPKHLKQSMFEHGGQHAVVCRYSSEPGDPGLDVRPRPYLFSRTRAKIC